MHPGDKIQPGTFISKMHPHPKSQSNFKYLLGGLLQVKGVVKENELRRPKQLSANGEECLLVVKNGMGTGLTIGRLTGIESVIRDYSDYGIGKTTTLEFAILPYSHKDGTFSAASYSGSIVVDGGGCLVGLLTGSSGVADSTDVAYIMPYFWLEERIKQAFPGCFLYQTTDL